MRKYAGPMITVGVIIAILAAIAVPNLIVAMNRSHQKRTMADMRTIATAIEAYAADKNHYDLDSFHGPNRAVHSQQFDALHPVRYSDLERTLVPTYIKQIPRIDGWGQEFEVRTGDYDAKGHARMYALRSFGSDGAVDRDSYKMGATATHFEDDIVLSLGNFTRYPESI